jgi:hypothetical protein
MSLRLVPATFILHTADAAAVVQWGGGRGSIDLASTVVLGSGTLTVTYIQNNLFTATQGNPVGTGLVFTAAGNQIFEIGAGYLVFTLSGSTAAVFPIKVASTSKPDTNVPA